MSERTLAARNAVCVLKRLLIATKGIYGGRSQPPESWHSIGNKALDSPWQQLHKNTSAESWRLRSVWWLFYFAAIILAWIWLFLTTKEMGLDLLGRRNASAEMMASMDLSMMAHMPMTNYMPLFGMWAIMMAAMMLPVLVPTLITYEQLIYTANGSRRGWLGVLCGYIFVWMNFAMMIAGLQLLLLSVGIIDFFGVATSPFTTAALLIVVGSHQFTRVKEICHGICIAPLLYFLANWKTGFLGGLRMGLALGVFCVLCCWGIMLLGFVGGVMNLLWMGVATVFMVLEKLPQVGGLVSKPMGIALILFGAVIFFQPEIIGG